MESLEAKLSLKRLEYGKLSVQELAYRDILIERGLRECNELLEQETGNRRFLYEGNINGFELCKKFTKLSEYEGTIKELRQKEENLFKGYLDSNDSSIKTKVIEQYWYTRGRRAQVEFVLNKIVVLKILQSSLGASEILKRFSTNEFY